MDIWTAFQQLALDKRQQFLHLRDNASRVFPRMTEAFAENSFATSNSPPVHGAFLLHSRFNHSCIPNSKVPETGGEIIASFATREIIAGEEITFCYNSDFECRTRNDRHQKLRFVCDCKACLPGTRFQQLSDMRRTLIRGLHYLTHGADMNGQRQDSAFVIIVDSVLKNAAEDFRITISARLIYNLLIMSLMDDEGLLDDFMVERMNPGILQISTLFQTESNARIARLAMAQDTWLGKFCVAFRLYGRGDMADHAIAVQLRMLRKP
jgi:hypothetical protein